MLSLTRMVGIKPLEADMGNKLFDKFFIITPDRKIALGKV